MDALSIGAALALEGGAAARASEAAQAAKEAAEEANKAAEGASEYVGKYASLARDANLDDAALRLMISDFRAAIRSNEKRIAALESQIAALAQ